jgi:peptidoglycan/LPS O-acetylase OafA/YrhL
MSSAELSEIKTGAGRLPSLDGLRAVSIFLVLGWHLNSEDRVPGAWFISYYYGTLGVQIFFVISGFLITWLLLAEEAQVGSVSLKSFYARRALRILPVQFAYLSVLALLTFTTRLHWTACQVLTAITYTKDFGCQGWVDGHLWSLSVEEQFYLLWPPILVLTKRRTAVVVSLVLIVLFPVLRAVFHATHILRFTGLMFFDNIMIGCLAALVARHAPNRLGRCLSWYSTVLRTTAVLLMIAMNVLQDKMLLGIVTVPFAFTIQAGCAAYLICSYAFNRTGLGYVILNARPVAYIGVLSYSLYIWQQLFFSDPRLFGWESSPLLTFPINLALAFATAMASYHLFELPLLSLRSRFRPKQNRSDAAQFARNGSPVLQEDV